MFVLSWKTRRRGACGGRCRNVIFFKQCRNRRTYCTINDKQHNPNNKFVSHPPRSWFLVKYGQISLYLRFLIWRATLDGILGPTFREDMMFSVSFDNGYFIPHGQIIFYVAWKSIADMKKRRSVIARDEDQHTG